MFPIVFAPTIEYPLSGDVSQDIAPRFVDIAGIPEVEWQMITQHASYGTQLGKLTEAVLALAEKIGLEGEEIAAVRQIAASAEQAKEEALASVQDRAAKAAGDVERLRRRG